MMVSSEDLYLFIPSNSNHVVLYMAQIAMTGVKDNVWLVIEASTIHSINQRSGLRAGLHIYAPTNRIRRTTTINFRIMSSHIFSLVSGRLGLRLALQSDRTGFQGFFYHRSPPAFLL